MEANTVARALGVHPQLSGLGHHRGDEVVLARLDVIDERVEDARSFLRRELGPDTGVEAAARLGDRPLDRRQGRDGDGPDVGLVGRVLDGE